jgi:ribonuclease D
MSLPPYELITDATSWAYCLARLQIEPRLAIDLEANSMHAYQEEVCLIQISIAHQDYIVDPLSDIDLAPFGDLLEDPDVEKVFHAAEYDLFLMKRQFGWELRNLFDTLWAARILGYQRYGLANMLEQFYDVSLNKRYQKSNWCRRPLSSAQLSYAQYDTHYLLRLRDDLAEELAETGRVEEAAEIFAEQSDVEPPDISFDPDSFWSIRGARKLSRRQQAILKALAIYRDKEAQRRDRPHFKVLGDRTLLDLARQAPRRKEELSRVYGMSGGQVRRYGRGLLRVIEKARRHEPPRRPRRSRRPPEDVYHRYEILHRWRKERGRERGVESDVIVSKDTLWEMAHRNPQTVEALREIEGIGEWRRRTYGEEIVALLRNSK